MSMPLCLVHCTPEEILRLGLRLLTAMIISYFTFQRSFVTFGKIPLHLNALALYCTFLAVSGVRFYELRTCRSVQCL